MSQGLDEFYGHCSMCGQPATTMGFLCGCKHRPSPIPPIPEDEPTLHELYVAALERIAKLTAALNEKNLMHLAAESEVDGLEAENTRLKAPVSAPFVSVSWAIQSLSQAVHSANTKWWVAEDGTHLQRNVYELLCLIHSEISEAMEGHRKSLMDDKLPHRTMLEVELADVLIRVVDMAAGLKLDLAGAATEKMAYNATRLDHKQEAKQIASRAAIKDGQ